MNKIYNVEASEINVEASEINVEASEIVEIILDFYKKDEALKINSIKDVEKLLNLENGFFKFCIEKNDISILFSLSEDDELNEYIVERLGIAPRMERFNKNSVEFKAHSLANYGQIFTIFRNAALILLIIAFVSVNYVYVPVDQEKKAILTFFLIIGALSSFLVLYTVAFVKVKLDNDFIEFKGKNYHFSTIRNIVTCDSILSFGKHIELYPIDKVKPIILYMNNTDDMKLIKEFYEDYRLKEEYKKGFTICIKKLITINFKKK